VTAAATVIGGDNSGYSRSGLGLMEKVHHGNGNGYRGCGFKVNREGKRQRKGEKQRKGERRVWEIEGMCEVEGLRETL